MPTSHEINYAKAMRLYAIARDMKMNGVKVDMKRRQWHLDRLDKESSDAEVTFRLQGASYLAADAKLGNPETLHDLFFAQLGLPVRLNKKTGRPTVDKEALQLYKKSDNPLVKELATSLLLMRQADKTRRDLRGWTIYPDGYCHPNFNPYAADTWRWSGSDPNMQQRQKTVKEKAGTDANGKPIYRILRYGDRDCFICEDDEEICEADYSQLEARNLTLFSGEPALMTSFNVRGFDVHSLNAMDLTGQVNKRTRDMAKKAMYGMQNMGTPETLYKNMAPEFPDLQYALVEELVRRWHEKRPAIRQWQMATYNRARREKQIVLPFSGKVYRFYLDRVEGPTVIAEFIQGSAADIVNDRTIVLADRLAKVSPSAGVKMMLQIHDAIITRYKKEARDEVVGITRECLETTREYEGRTMNYYVDVKVGQCWETMEELKEAA